MHRTIRAGVALLALAPAGCDRAEPPGAAVAEWRVAPEPLWRLGGLDAPAEQHFLNVGQVALVSDRVVVPSRGLGEVRVFDRSGRLDRVVSRGHGPDELTAIFGVHACDNHTVAIRETRGLALLDVTSGTITRRDLAAHLPAGGIVHGFGGSCERVLVEVGEVLQPPFPAGGTYHAMLSLRWLDLETRASVEALELPGPERVTVPLPAGAFPMVVPWGRFPRWAAGPSGLYAWPGEGFEVWVVGGERPWRTLGWPGTEREVGALQRRAYAAELDRLTRGSPEEAQLVPALHLYPVVSPTLPAIDRMLVDDRGRVWLREHPALGLDWAFGPRPAGREEWWVLDGAGAWIARVTLPERFTLNSVRGDEVVGVWHDDNDVEEVRGYRLDGPEAEGG